MLDALEALDQSMALELSRQLCDGIIDGDEIVELASALEEAPAELQVQVQGLLRRGLVSVDDVGELLEGLVSANRSLGRRCWSWSAGVATAAMRQTPPAASRQSPKNWGLPRSGR